MTDIRKSEAQLDAEAAQPLEERDLDAAIADHRQLYRAETGILRLHQRDGDDAGLGPPFNHHFADYLSEDYGAFPWHRSLMFLRWAVCRRTHAKHWEPKEWRGSLCYELVSMVIRREYALDQARLRLGLPEEGKTRRTLDSALLVIERKMEAQREPPEIRREPAEWMALPHVHRHPPGSSLEDCPQCLRGAA